MDERFWYLKQCNLFAGLAPEQIAAIESRSRFRTFERGRLIYLPSDAGDAMLLLSSGRVKIFHVTADGKQAVLAIIEPGEVFGELAVLDGGSREEFAEAMEPVGVILIPGREVQRLMAEQPSVSLEVTRMLGLRRRRTERRLKSLLFRSNRERLVSLLLEFVERYGRTEKAGIALAIKLAHQELANMIGSTRETVTVILGELQREGSLVIRRRQIVLTALDRLAAEIGIPPPELPSCDGVLSTPVFRPVPQDACPSS